MLIVIEGADASGKATQTQLLFEALKEKGLNVLKIEFPDYESPSSSLVKMYLKGDFGSDANSVNSYAASSFFAVDRFASYQTKWKTFYEEGGIVIADRYVTANLFHQAGKIACPKEKEDFLNWIQDFEYNKLGLPRPDLAFFLDVPPLISASLMKERLNKFSGESEKDIHEGDWQYILNTYKNAKEIAQQFDFAVINCVKGESLRSINNIHEEIIKIVEDQINDI